MSEKAEDLKIAALFALGWMCAKADTSDPVITLLARALKANGSDSTYVQEIVAKAEREGR